MPISVRLDSELEGLVDRTCRALGQKKSEVIRDAIRSHCVAAALKQRTSLYDRIKDLIGNADDLPADLSRNSRKYISAFFDAKRRCRRSR